MKFTKTIRDTSVQFEIDNMDEDSILVKIMIPPYGSWKRGEQYSIKELNQVVLQEIDEKLIPTRTDGRCKALREETKIVGLEYKKLLSQRKIEKVVSHSLETAVKSVHNNPDVENTKKVSRSKSSRTKKR